jgi:phage tail-like protein
MTKKARLIVRLGDAVVQTQELGEALVTIGRLPENTIVLAGAQVSGLHAQIRTQAEGVVLIDLDSVSGTFVDGVRLAPRTPHTLLDGSEIQIGLYLLTYRTKEANPEEQILKSLFSVAPTATKPPATPPKVPREPRPTVSAMRLDTDSRSKYLEQLPIIFHDSDLFRRMLLIFENIWEQLEQRQDFLEMYFDPRTCPASFLRWLASWFDVAIDPHWPEARIRALLLELIQLYRWRGTKYGLTRMLEVCAGVGSEISVSPTSPFVLNITAWLGQQSVDHAADRVLIEQLVNAHKPAHVGYLLEVRE